MYTIVLYNKLWLYKIVVTHSKHIVHFSEIELGTRLQFKLMGWINNIN